MYFAGFLDFGTHQLEELRIETDSGTPQNFLEVILSQGNLIARGE